MSAEDLWDRWKILKKFSLLQFEGFLISANYNWRDLQVKNSKLRFTSWDRALASSGFCSLNRRIAKVFSVQSQLTQSYWQVVTQYHWESQIELKINWIVWRAPFNTSKSNKSCWEWTNKLWKIKLELSFACCWARARRVRNPQDWRHWLQISLRKRTALHCRAYIETVKRSPYEANVWPILQWLAVCGP